MYRLVDSDRSTKNNSMVEVQQFDGMVEDLNIVLEKQLSSEGRHNVANFAAN